MTNGIFFGATGLSMADANHAANMAKEMAKEHEAFLACLPEGAKKRELDGKVLVDPSVYDMRSIADAVEQIAKLYQVSAWMREAIKTKNSLMESIRNRPLDPVPFNVPRPQLKHENHKQVSESDVVEKWSFKDRFEYIGLEASAAHIGKTIHNNGPIAQLRESTLDSKEWVQNRLMVNGAQNDVFIKVTNVYQRDEVNSLFFDTQKKHRKAESRLNYFKAKLKNELSTIQVEEEQRFQKAMKATEEKYHAELSEWEKRRDAWNSKNDTMLSQHRAKISEDLKEASQVKIVVPDELRSLVAELLS